MYRPGYCPHCTEKIEAHDRVHPTMKPPHHLECAVRMFSGPAAHILKECSCFTGDKTARHEPEGLPLRECAKLAFEAFTIQCQKDHEDGNQDWLPFWVER